MWALYSGTLAFWTPVPSARGVHSRIPLYPDQGGGLRPVVLGCRMSPISPIRRHQVLVNCAFSFCWDAWFHDNPAPQQPAAPRPGPSRGERGAARRRPPASALMAAGAARDTRLAFPLDRAATLVAGMVHSAPATAAAGPHQLRRGGLRPAPLHPELTNYR
jgi:hypothetical protein